MLIARLQVHVVIVIVIVIGRRVDAGRTRLVVGVVVAGAGDRHGALVVRPEAEADVDVEPDAEDVAHAVRARPVRRRAAGRRLPAHARRRRLLVVHAVRRVRRVQRVVERAGRAGAAPVCDARPVGVVMVGVLVVRREPGAVQVGQRADLVAQYAGNGADRGHVVLVANAVGQKTVADFPRENPRVLAFQFLDVADYLSVAIDL